jgi:pilus assembly protein FimV
MAARIKPAGTTTEQTMAALVQANPHAFNDGNPNKLKAGVTMKVPAAGKIKALTAEQVNGILHADGTTAPAAAQTPAAAPAAAVAKSAPAAKGKSGDVLKLVPAEAAGGQPDGKLSVLEQQVSAREQSLKDAEARIAAWSNNSSRCKVVSPWHRKLLLWYRLHRLLSWMQRPVRRQLPRHLWQHLRPSRSLRLNR